jgi:hypothetical protein
MIKPWVFEFLPELGSPSVEPNPADVTTLFARYLDLWVHDEALGFEGIFFSEHHFGRSYSPSPNLLIAALGSRTNRCASASWESYCPTTIQPAWWRKSACWTT